MNRILLAIAIPLGLIVLGIIALPVILFGRAERRTEIARGMSRTLSGIWDGQGDCTASAWSYFLVIRGKKDGPWRVTLIDWINRKDGHCKDAYLWHEAHGLFDEKGDATE